MFYWYLNIYLCLYPLLHLHPLHSLPSPYSFLSSFSLFLTPHLLLLPLLSLLSQTHPELQEIPVFYASKLASKALRVYQTFVNMMNSHIRGKLTPFLLTFYSYLVLSSRFCVFSPFDLNPLLSCLVNYSFVVNILHHRTLSFLSYFFSVSFPFNLSIYDRFSSFIILMMLR